MNHFFSLSMSMVFSQKVLFYLIHNQLHVQYENILHLVTNINADLFWLLRSLFHLIYHFICILNDYTLYFGGLILWNTLRFILEEQYKMKIVQYKILDHRQIIIHHFLLYNEKVFFLYINLFVIVSSIFPL